MNTILPNLSTWHPVPVGATIPKGTPYAYAYEDGVTVELGGHSESITVRDRNSYSAHYTEHPIARPLPTEPGTTILATSNEYPPSVLLTIKDGMWTTCYGNIWYDYQIVAWAPVTIGETVVIR